MPAHGYELYGRVLIISLHELAKQTSKRYHQHEKTKFLLQAGM